MINKTEKGSGLNEALTEAGIQLRKRAGEWVCIKPVAYGQVAIDARDAEIQAVIDAYDPTAYELSAALKRFSISAQKYVDVESKKDKYPEFEQQTWGMQREDVVALQSNASASTPTLDMIATHRGRDREAHIAATTPKALGYVQLSLYAAGKRQAKEDEADAAALTGDWEAISKMELVL